MGFPIRWDSLLRSLKHPALWRCFLRGGGYAAVTRLHISLEVAEARRIYEGLTLSTFSLEELPTVVARTRDRLLRRLCLANSYLYPVVRLLRPQVVVETGVHYGISSAFILAAMQDNGGGELWSIDLPNQQYEATPGGRMVSEALPGGCETGFVVPGEFRDRWHLLQGDAREVLPRLLDSLGLVDVFLHDSAHTYEVMRFEYATAWRHIGRGGLLLSDDVGWNSAFQEFAAEAGAPFAVSRGQVGVLVKP